MIKVSLQEANPELAKQWHPTKNGSLTPGDVTRSSHKKAWWRCDQGHEWQATVSNRKQGSNCPYCAGKAVCNDNCLATLNPGLAKQWHPTKNDKLTPSDVTRNSHKKVWWECSNGHKWEAKIEDRNYGRGCPYCSKRAAACNDNCLATLNSDLAKQWHPTKNGSLTPDNVTLHSNKKVWWVCDKGHEWEAVINNRNTGQGCPYCAGKAVCNDNCLATLNPGLIEEWHPTKNGSLTPADVARNSHKKVWWKCKKGHEWQARIQDRNYGSGCPKCNAKISQLELRIYCELQYLFPSTEARKKIDGKECDIYIPEIKAGVEVDGVYWHRNKYLQDKKKAAAIRSKGIILISVREAGLERISETDIFHAIEADVLTVIKEIVRTINEQCSLNENKKKAINKYLERSTLANDSGYKRLWDILPSPFPELSLLALSPELSKEWNKEKNGTLSPKDVSLFSAKKVWWICDKGHEWQATVNSRSIGQGCPYCAGQAVCNDNCLATLNPALAKQWHPTKNSDKTPKDFTPGSNWKSWWLCEKGHEWQATVHARNSGTGCPYCDGKLVCNDNCLATVNPDLAKQWHPTKNGNLKPEDVHNGSGKKAWWRCNNGHEWQSIIKDRNKGIGCPYCAGNAVCEDNCLATLNPGLAKQWHPTKNGKLTPRDVTRGSHTKVWWVCDKGHEWQAVIKDRRGCPKCWSLKRSKST
jgi:hypothetical protein